MKAYCRNGIVVATHDDEQNVDPTVYGDGVTVIRFDSLGELTRVGDPPPPGLPDTRPYAAPDPGSAPPSTAPPLLVAAALNLQVVNGDFGQVQGTFNVVAAAYLGVGSYLIFFLTPQPDDNYFVVFSGGAVMSVTDKTTDGFQFEAHDASGASVDPPPFGAVVYRIAT
ncbi:MAG TPA: hypothetical protein VGH62_01455 [Bradyrhizobium sp.]|jgi:hypothetical protein